MGAFGFTQISIHRRRANAVIPTAASTRRNGDANRSLALPESLESLSAPLPGNPSVPNRNYSARSTRAITGEVRGQDDEPPFLCFALYLSAF